MQETVSKRPNGNLDYQTMADYLGEVSRIFIIDNTGIVRCIINTTPQRGNRSA